MLLLLLAVSLCLLATIMLTAKVSYRWFFVVACTSFVIHLMRERVTFVDENQTFFSLAWLFFLALALHLQPDKEDSGLRQRMSASSQRKFIPRILILTSCYFLVFLSDALRVHWTALDERAQAESVLLIYMGIVGIFFLWQTRLEEERLEP